MAKRKHLNKENKEIKMEPMQNNNMKTIRRKKSQTVIRRHITRRLG